MSNTKRPSTGPLSEREITRQFGISRAVQWRAKKVAEIPEAEFEAMIDGDNPPPTVSALVAHAHGRQQPPSTLQRLVKAWNAASHDDRRWLLDALGP